MSALKVCHLSKRLLEENDIFHYTEVYRSGHNGNDSKSFGRLKPGSWVRISPPPPALSCQSIHDGLTAYFISQHTGSGDGNCESEVLSIHVIALADANFDLYSKCAYVLAVTAKSLCPNHSWICFSGTPHANNKLAHECLKSWKRILRNPFSIINSGNWRVR